MNTLKQILFSLCLLYSLTLSAQKNDAATELPYTNKFEISDRILETIFQANGKIALDLTPDFKLEGIIENKSVHSNSVVSMLIKEQGSPYRMLSISRYQDPNGLYHYTGHLMKLHETGGFVLKEKDQHYYFIETKQKFLVSE